jgi:MFS superfamily sulfate permease-like transporter
VTKAKAAQPRVLDFLLTTYHFRGFVHLRICAPFCFRKAVVNRSETSLIQDLIAGLTTGVANIPDAMASAILAAAN